MSIRKRVAIVLLVLGTAVPAALPVGVSASGSTPPKFHPPQQNYLALGDSLAFGYQGAKFAAEVATNTYSAASFNTGYDADFAAMIQPLAPPGRPFQETNYGCPGETTSSMVSGGCLFSAHYALHNSYPPGDSQLEAAVSFLRAHPHSVNPITLDIGANDILNLISTCSFSLTCIEAGIAGVTATMAANLNEILGTLRTAAPGAEIIVMNVPDPFEFVFPLSLQLFAGYNQVLDAVVAAHNVRLVDAFAVLEALYPYQLTTFCSLDAFCADGDIHPTDLGYSVLASYFFAASGYASLS